MSEHAHEEHHDEHGHGFVLPTKINATREQLDAYRIPNASRNVCADFQIALAHCHAHHGQIFFGPHACDHDLHVLEQCRWELQKRTRKEVNATNLAIRLKHNK